MKETQDPVRAATIGFIAGLSAFVLMVLIILIYMPEKATGTQGESCCPDLIGTAFGVMVGVVVALVIALIVMLICAACRKCKACKEEREIRLETRAQQRLDLAIRTAERLLRSPLNPEILDAFARQIKEGGEPVVDKILKTLTAHDAVVKAILNMAIASFEPEDNAVRGGNPSAT